MGLDDPRLAPYRLVTDAAALARAGLFVAEGRWVVERLLARPQYTVESVLVTPTAHAAMFGPIPEPRTVPIHVVEQAVMDQLVGFNIHRGCLALARRPAVAVLSEDGIAGAERIVVLEGVNNPDNVGGIFRSAAAFGVDRVVLGPACGDPLYRKAIRTSMAATLDVPYLHSGSWPGALDTLRAAGFHVAAMTPTVDALPLESFHPGGPVALLLGTEGAGLTAAALAHADSRVRVNMTSRVDSLNVTVAGSIALHHLFVR